MIAEKMIELISIHRFIDSDATEMVFDTTEMISDTTEMVFDTTEMIFDTTEMIFDATENGFRYHGLLIRKYKRAP